MTAPRAQRRTRPIENPPVAHQPVKSVDPLPNELISGLFSSSAPAWEEDLFARFPFFFRAVHHPDSYTASLSRIGMMCGSGWYSIIEQLAYDAEMELRTCWREQLQFPEKMAELDVALASGRAVSPVLPYCTYVGQADGELKVELVYGSLCPSDVRNRICVHIEIAKERSRCTCEGCGSSGTLREINFRRVYCEDCLPDLSLKRKVASAPAGQT